MNVHDSYDSAAEAYAHHLASELDRKPLDRHLLNRFAEEARGRGLVADIGCGPGHVARYLHGRGVSIVGIDETDTGRISGISPVARALLGKSGADTAKGPTPTGAERIEIVAIATPNSLPTSHS